MKDIFSILFVILIFITIIFLATITSIETTYANHTKYHLNNSLVDVTISGDDIPDALLDDIKRGILRDMKVEEKKAFEKNNNSSQFQIESSQEAPKGKIILTSHKYTEIDDSEFDDLIGQVKNVGNGTAEDISIIFTYYDVEGNLIDTSSVMTNADILQPGQKDSFYNFRDASKTPDMAYYEIALSWYNSDGTKEYNEDVEVTKDPQEKIPIIENSEEKSKNENIPFFNLENKDIVEKDDKDEDEDDDKDDNDEDEDDDNDDKDEDEDDDKDD